MLNYNLITLAEPKKAHLKIILESGSVDQRFSAASMPFLLTFHTKTSLIPFRKKLCVADSLENKSMNWKHTNLVMKLHCKELEADMDAFDRFIYPTVIYWRQSVETYLHHTKCDESRLDSHSKLPVNLLFRFCVTAVTQAFCPVSGTPLVT